MYSYCYLYVCLTACILQSYGHFCIVHVLHYVSFSSMSRLTFSFVGEKQQVHWKLQNLKEEISR
jgi:hypothetical protein